jgi:hypothetical protein
MNLILKAISNYLDKHSTKHHRHYDHHTLSIPHGTTKTTYIQRNPNNLILTTYNHAHNLPHNKITIDLADPDLFQKITQFIKNQ